ncbi:B12-binding domain-containing radical SAM protein [Chloroflexota bacterium]
MDILLIDPPYASLKGMSVERCYNIGLTSLAAYLRHQGMETAVLMGDMLTDLRRSLSQRLLPGISFNPKEYAAGQHKYETIVSDRSHPIWKSLAQIVRQTSPLAVGIPYLTPTKYAVERVASLIKEVDREIKVIVGSFHPTFCPEEVMQNPDIDFVVRGEGEVPLLSLVKELKKDSPEWAKVPGIHYRDGKGRVRSNAAASLIENLDALPYPARNLVLNSDYDFYRLHCVSTTRGCPYTCSFCADRRLWGGKIRRRSVESVIKELSFLKDTYKITFVDIVDGTFTFDRKYVQAFCRALIDRNLNIKWRCTARYDNLNEDLLQLMKQANCSGLYLGLESGSDRILKAIDKKMNVEMVVSGSKMVRDSGIQTATSILLGLPNEGKKDIEDTLQLMKRLETDILDVNSYIPLAGTPLYDAINEEDRRNIDWRKVGMKSFDNYFLKDISHEDFKKYLFEAYGIANSVRRKTLLRIGARRFFHSITRMFGK